MSGRLPVIKLIPALLCVSTWCAAQTPSVPDTAFLRVTAQRATDLYAAAVKTQMHLYNGSQYLDYDPIKDEHPYFVDSDWTTGWIIYDDERYDNTSLLYNINNDKIVAEHYAGAFIDLIATKVAAFHVHGHTFRRLTTADDKRGGITEGFYDILYDGKVKIIAKHTKKFTQTVDMHEYENNFEEKTHYYIVRDQNFFIVRSKKNALDILGDHKQEMKQFLRAGKLSFKRQREQALVKMAAYHDTLTP
jgi:hypothetical protein